MKRWELRLKLLVQNYTVNSGLPFMVLDGCHLGKMIDILTNEFLRRLILMSKRSYKALSERVRDATVSKE